MSTLLDNLKKRYFDRVIENNRRKALLDEFVNLSKSDEVKRYLELSKVIDENPVCDEDYIINMTFNKRRENVQFGCDIYVYFGAYFETRSNIYLDGKLTKLIDASDFLLYKELVDVYNVGMVSYDKNNDFYDGKIIIRFDDYNFSKREDYEEAYNRLRAFYCKNLLDGKNKDEILELIENNKDKFNILSISYDLEPGSRVRRKIK